MNLPTAETPCLHGHCTLHRQEIANTILKPLYGDFLRVRGVSVKLLSLCFEEQLQLRMLGQQAQGRDLESLPSDPDPGELRVVQELCKQWLGRAGPKSKKGTPADKMPALRFLHGQLQQHQQQSQRRPTEEASRVPAGGVTETETATDGMPAPSPAAPAADSDDHAPAPAAAVAPAAPKENESAEQGQGDSPSDVEVAEAAEAGPGGKGCKRDMHGNPVNVGDVDVVRAKKAKDKYDNRLAKVQRINQRHALVMMTSGPAKGTTHRVMYHSFEKEGAVPDAMQLASMQCVRQSKGPASETAAPAVDVVPDSQGDEPQDALCREMFGNLGDFS